MENLKLCLDFITEASVDNLIDWVFLLELLNSYLEKAVTETGVSGVPWDGCLLNASNIIHSGCVSVSNASDPGTLPAFIYCSVPYLVWGGDWNRTILIAIVYLVFNQLIVY